MTGKHAVRKRLPDTRESITRHTVIDYNTDIYITVGLYPDTGQPGEVFITVGKVGSTVHGMIDLFGLNMSLLLQYGVDLEDLCDKWIGISFEPKGITDDKDIPRCSSIPDYVARWLKLHYIDKYHPKDKKPSA